MADTTSWLPANVTILDLAAGTTVTGTELLEAVQTSGGVPQSVSLTVNQILSAITTSSMPGPYQTGNLTRFGIVYGNGTSALGATAAGTTGWPLVGNGTAVAASFAVLGMAGGGVGTTTLTLNGVVYGNNGTTVSITAAGATSSVLVCNGAAPLFTTSPTFAGNLTVGGSIVGGDFIGGFVLSPAIIGGVLGNSTLTLESTLGAGTTDAIIFQTGSQVERMRILSSGGVAIGTTADPGPANLRVTGSASLGTPLSVPNGGTGTSILTADGVLYGLGTSIVGITAAGATSLPLTGQGAGNAPSFAALTVPGGGTGTTILTAHGVLVGEGTSVVGITAAGGTNFVFMGTGAANDPSFTGTPSIATSLAVGTTNSPGIGNVYAQGFFNSVAGFTRVATANFTATASNTTLANITGLSAALGTAVYDFEALVYATASTVGGAKVAVAYSGSVNSIVYQAVCYDGSISTTLLANNGRATASGAAIATCTAAPVPTFRIIGNINATTPGNLTVQIAQAVAATQSTIVLGGSSLKVFQMN